MQKNGTYAAVGERMQQSTLSNGFAQGHARRVGLFGEELDPPLNRGSTSQSPACSLSEGDVNQRVVGLRPLSIGQTGPRAMRDAHLNLVTPTIKTGARRQR